MITKTAFVETIKTLKDLFHKEDNLNTALDEYDETITHSFLPYHDSLDKYGAGLMLEAFEIADCSDRDTQNFLEILYYFLYDCDFGEDITTNHKVVYSSYEDEFAPLITEEVDLSSAGKLYDYLISRIQEYKHGYTQENDNNSENSDGESDN